MDTFTFRMHTSSHSVKTCTPSNSSQALFDPAALYQTGYHGSQTPMLQRQPLLLLFQQSVCVCVCYLGLSSGGALLKLTTGICRVVGRECSEGARNGLGGSRGERKGELSPLLRRSGERGARDTEFCSSSPSSSSRIDGSFFTKPPLLSQST